MKKILLFLLAVLPMTVILQACSDDNDLPDVDFTLTYEGATEVDGVLYVVQNSEFKITGITVTNREEGKGAGISDVDFYWDYVYQGTSIQPPYSFGFEISDKVPVGRHVFGIQCPVFAVGKTLARAYVEYRVQVVASAEDIPSGGNSSSTTTPVISEATD